LNEACPKAENSFKKQPFEVIEEANLKKTNLNLSEQWYFHHFPHQSRKKSQEDSSSDFFIIILLQ
jgi:hypothetical protein